MSTLLRIVAILTVPRPGAARAQDRGAECDDRHLDAASGEQPRQVEGAERGVRGDDDWLTRRQQWRHRVHDELVPVRRQGDQDGIGAVECDRAARRHAGPELPDDLALADERGPGGERLCALA
jgi:hypothetical protein